MEYDTSLQSVDCEQTTRYGNRAELRALRKDIRVPQVVRSPYWHGLRPRATEEKDPMARLCGKKVVE